MHSWRLRVWKLVISVQGVESDGRALRLLNSRRLVGPIGEQLWFQSWQSSRSLRQLIQDINRLDWCHRDILILVKLTYFTGLEDRESSSLPMCLRLHAKTHLNCNLLNHHLQDSTTPASHYGSLWFCPSLPAKPFSIIAAADESFWERLWYLRSCLESIS